MWMQRCIKRPSANKIMLEMKRRIRWLFSICTPPSQTHQIYYLSFSLCYEPQEAGPYGLWPLSSLCCLLPVEFCQWETPVNEWSMGGEVSEFCLYLIYFLAVAISLHGSSSYWAVVAPWSPLALPPGLRVGMTFSTTANLQEPQYCPSVPWISWTNWVGFHLLPKS